MREFVADDPVARELSSVPGEHQYGIDAEMLRQQFGRYTDRFVVPDEPIRA
jgi:hypothetical protein